MNFSDHIYIFEICSFQICHQIFVENTSHHMEANMKDIIARLATHQTTPISTCDDDDDRDDDVDTDVDDGSDEIKASFALGL